MVRWGGRKKCLLSREIKRQRRTWCMRERTQTMAFTAASSSLFVRESSAKFLSSLFFLPEFQNHHRGCCRSFTSRNVPLIKASSASTQFNITFGARKKENPSPEMGEQDSSSSIKAPQKELPSQPAPLFIPWIVKDENGNLKIQSTPPAHILSAMAEASTAKKTKKKKEGGSKSGSLSAEPKHSKAARRFYNQNFREPQRLSKVLASAGVASRRSSEELIFDGKVTVNGSVCNVPQTRVDPIKDVIYVNGSRLAKKLPPKLYFALNKPKGYICSSSEKESKSVLMLFDDYWKSWDCVYVVYKIIVAVMTDLDGWYCQNKINPGIPKPRLFTVGRLDVATTGLIIVTNDGDFAQRIAHPSSGLKKEYIAAIEGNVHRRHLQLISDGTIVEGKHCTPDLVEHLPAQPGSSRSRLRIVVNEGRNREVREIVKNAGLELHSLKRVRIGGFKLPAGLGLVV
ncbi:uncharacterized protein LOC18438664 isoform X3 [Amborella trichopoda]|uniref:uncharacterized protein LOC18438664 isoform X3 n=1 Tax=Amborella trichopoda TaxID=13333 RepID=UPI0009BD722F|nr:uncharacterized protein LOC18438664 isoform X3 [Amborella trichopoda]|eukprot:XP_020525764.1 uncharacterized protein LOC18438664 isoform X3 [Amborella trichopoda]